MDITEDKADHKLQLMVMSSSPGILDGDEYSMTIEIGENSSLELLTQSYQRLYKMKTGATQFIDVHMDSGSSFVYLPHPCVPHESSCFTARNKIYLSNDCKLIWGEVLSCGRKLSGESFLFSKYHSLTEIYLNGRLVVKENLFVQPLLIDVNAIGQLEGYSHQASLICINKHTQLKDTAGRINEYLAMQDEISFGISCLEINGLAVRLLGHRAEQLHDCLKEIRDLTPLQEWRVEKASLV